MSQLDHTIWRGIEIAHPAEWELSVASPAGKKGRCAFSDRYWQRLDVTWQPVPSPPKIDLLLQKFRDEHLKRIDPKDTDRLVEIVGAPDGWRGFRQHHGDTAVTRALRYDPETRLVQELAALWPKKLDADLERELMAGVRPVDLSGDTRHWRAMGLDVQLDRAYDLTVAKPLAGRTHWEFETPGKDQRKLYIERLATPELWLKGSLADWLPKQAPAAATMLNQRAITVNEHRGQEVLTRSKVGRFGSWRGRYKVRLEQAWLCEREGRLYRACLTDVTRDEALTLPPGLTIRCCQPSQAIPDPGDKSHRQIRLAAKGGARTTAQFLAAVPFVNEVASVEPRPNGGATIAIEMKRPWYMTPPISWLLPFGSHRRVQLDPVGADILATCDGKRPVEKVIEIFAATHKLTFREAQLPVTQYLRQLTQRGILVIVGLKTEP